MNKRIKVGVVFGGSSTEREVSLITGRSICENLDTQKYIVSVIEMDKTQQFWLKEKRNKRLVDFANKDRKKFDIIFIALHGSPGEDGSLQGMFETLGIKYTGSGVLASALAMNKVYAAQIYIINKLPHPEFIHFKKTGWENYKKNILKDITTIVGYPAVIKPVDQGSAIGVSIVQNEKDLITVINKTIKEFPWLMVQKFIKGQEATCGVLEKRGKIFALPPTRIIANAGDFYNYQSKYSQGGSTHICPAYFGQETNKRLQDLALSAHRALQCRGMSRTDIFVADEKEKGCGCDSHGESHEHNKLYIIETNTIPGMTPTSLLPEAAKKAGIKFSEMLDLIIEASL